MSAPFCVSPERTYGAPQREFDVRPSWRAVRLQELYGFLRSPRGGQGIAIDIHHLTGEDRIRVVGSEVLQRGYDLLGLAGTAVRERFEIANIIGEFACVSLRLHQRWLSVCVILIEHMRVSRSQPCE